MTLSFTKISDDLPETVPFVGPESQERENSFSFCARLGANESVFGPSKMVIDAIKVQADEVWQCFIIMSVHQKTWDFLILCGTA